MLKSVVSKTMLVNGNFRKLLGEKCICLPLEAFIMQMWLILQMRSWPSWVCGLISAAMFCFPVEVYSRFPTPLLLLLSAYINAHIYWIQKVQKFKQQALLRWHYFGLQYRKSASFLGHENASTAILKEVYLSSLLGQSHWPSLQFTSPKMGKQYNNSIQA